MSSITNNEVSNGHAQFRAAAIEFLAAVKNRDYEIFRKFFREDLEFKAILPGGKVFDDVSSFLSSQAGWFNGSSGHFEYRLERTEISSDFGAAFACVEHSGVDMRENPFTLEIYILFLFRKIDDLWFLIYDHGFGGVPTESFGA